MSYDANSPQARKGALGEQIVKRLFERQGFDVQKPDGVPETTPTHLDWVAYNDDESEIFCIEVKTQKKFPYSFDAIDTFKIPLSKYEGYKDEAEERGGLLKMCFVSSEDGKIYCALSSTLDAPYRKGGFEFPVTVSISGDPEICFCIDQFVQVWDIDEDDLDALREIDAEMSIAAVDAKPEEVHIFTAPNGPLIQVLEVDGEFYVNVRHLRNAIGYKGNTWNEDGYFETAIIAPEIRTLLIDSKMYLDVRDVPDVLKTFVKTTATPLMNTQKFKRNETAKDLIAWFNEAVIPKLYGTFPQTATVEETFQSAETLSDMVTRLAQKIGLDAQEILNELRLLKIRQDPVLSELFGV